METIAATLMFLEYNSNSPIFYFVAKGFLIQSLCRTLALIIMYIALVHFVRLV